MPRPPRRAWLVLLCPVCSTLLAQQPTSAANLARTATASASEDQGPDLVAAFANDGDPATRWSGIPGHNSGVWYQLDWPQPVTLRQVVLHQFDTYVMELDVQVWDGAGQHWRTLRHCGVSGQKLPRVVAVDVGAVTTDRLRIADITNGPSFTEVEVFAAPVPPAVQLGSDLTGNVVGVVCDAWGSAAIAGASVELRGEAAGGAWLAEVTSDANGMFAAPMPIGLFGEVRLRTSVGGALHTTTWPAAALQYGLTPCTPGTGESLDGTWKFLADPPAGFEAAAFDDATWTSINVPGHWAMQGLRVRTAGGYRRHFDARGGAGRWLLRFDGVYSGAEVFVNGRRVATHDGGAVPFEADITDVVHERDNVLAVLATEHSVASDQLDKMSEYADMDLGGIFRSVRLSSVPALH
ncbi:MAG TPA: discoidin domain-containing protein, partial [Planctomycetota bacterium]|nr:discoidin domain-containing protein [Planctomycetota bacterium]